MTEDEPTEAVLVFREQADGRKVSRLAGGKVVLLGLSDVDRVQDGEKWLVRLSHRETFAIAEAVKRDATADSASAVRKRAPPRPDSEAAGHKAFKLQGMLIEPENVVREQDRVAFFVDGANMDGACRSAGYFIDYAKALEYFIGPGQLYAGFYYIADFTAQDQDSLQQRFLDFLSYSGYIVRRKPVKVIVDDETGERLVKGNLDTEIVLDMLNTFENYDVAFLFSGDSDFERAVDLLRSRGKRVFVVSSRRSISRELAYVADKPIFFLEDFGSVIAREGK